MSTDLEEQLRAALATRAHDPDVVPGAGLDDRAVRQASGMRRRRRLQVVAGVAVVAALVAAVPLVAGQQRADVHVPVQTPAPTPSASASGPAANAVAMARATGALLASGMTILDGAQQIELRPYNAPPEGWTYAIHGLSRAAGGYWVMYGPEALYGGLEDDEAARPPEKLVYVTAATADGRAVPLSTTVDRSSALAMDPDGVLVAYGAAGDDVNSHHLLLAETGEGMGGHPWAQPVTPLGFDGQSVWFSVLADPGGAPYNWDFRTDKVTELGGAVSNVALAQHGHRLVLSDYVSGCTSGVVAADVRHPQQEWRECGGISLARFSPDGHLLLTMVGGVSGAPTMAQLRDPGTGQVLTSTALPDQPFIDVQWTADSSHVSFSGYDEVSALASLAVTKTGGGWSLDVTDYSARGNGPVVVGVELPGAGS